MKQQFPFMRQVLLVWSLAFIYLSAQAQPFTYQGMLKQNGSPVNDTLSMTFKLYDAPTGGNQIGFSLTKNVPVQNGLFTVQLDFGEAWTGADRYLEITVGSTTLTPRVRITPTPYAAFAQRPWITNGSNIFYNSGNVGIGTNTPAARLSLGSDNANTKLAIWQGNTLQDVMGFGVGVGQFRFHLHNPNNRFSFLDSPSGTEIMTILGNGNVGIGTSAPTARLQVNGDIRLTDGYSIFGLGKLVGYNDLKLYGDSGVGDPDLLIRSNGQVLVGRMPSYGLPNDVTLTVNGIFEVLGSARFTSANLGSILCVIPGKLFDQDRSPAATLDISNGQGIIGIWEDLSVVGNTSLLGNLHVGGNKMTLGGGTDPNNWRRVELLAVDTGNGLFTGVVNTFGANGSVNTTLTCLGNFPNHGYMSVNSASGSNEAGMYVDSGGYGVVFADIKSFRVPDPDDATRDIYYGCIEGPELAMYVRGTARLVNGRARIELPDHFRKLADAQGMTVQLTPLSPDSKGLCVVRKGLDAIEVAELLNGRGNYEFDWEVKAVRKEHRDFRVYRPWNEVLPGGTDPAQAWAVRLKSIQDRQARQQAKETQQ